jgi:exopolysaccharide production protein ExoQ
LIILTDAEPIEAFKRLVSRLGFVLLPASVLLIKYYGDLGRGYTPDGSPMNTGVTTNKNSLGVITLVLGLGVLWHFIELFRNKDVPDRRRHLIAQGTLLAFSLALLEMAQSATAVACFILGAGLMLGTGLRVIRRRPGGVHALLLFLALVGAAVLFVGGGTDIIHALGRETTFTGRTDIWQAVIPVVPSPVFGAGYESFWVGPRVEAVWDHLSQYMHVNEAHNGYLEVYINLGWIGVCLISLVLIAGYIKIVGAFRRNPAVGSLLLAYLAAAAFYSITEAGFRLLDPIWLFLLLAVEAPAAVTSDVTVEATEPVIEPPNFRTFRADRKQPFVSRGTRVIGNSIVPTHPPLGRGTR